MSHLFRNLALCAALLVLPSGAVAGDAVAINDSMDFEQVIKGNIAPGTCSCFCTYEGFAATLTAPVDMSIRYIYFYYGTIGLTETIFDFHIYEGDEPGGLLATDEPELHFLAPNGDAAIGQFLPININSPQIIEIDVGQSGVFAPSVLAGETFTIAFHYNYDPDLGPIDFMEPGDGHGPGYDQDGERTEGTNWVLALTPSSVDCGAIGDNYDWIALESFGDPLFDFDWVIRASEQPVDWGGFSGDDDDAIGDDDDTSDDDDDDDAVGDLVVLGVTPPAMEEGTQIDVTITGTGFDDTAQVFIGGLQLSSVTFVSDQRLDAETPQAIVAADTPYDLLVSVSDGRQSTLPGAFTVRVAGGGCGDCSTVGAHPGASALLLLLLPLVGLRRRRG
jgi:hypothetical protein